MKTTRDHAELSDILKAIGVVLPSQVVRQLEYPDRENAKQARKQERLARKTSTKSRNQPSKSTKPPRPPKSARRARPNEGIIRIKLMTGEGDGLQSDREMWEPRRVRQETF